MRHNSIFKSESSCSDSSSDENSEASMYDECVNEESQNNIVINSQDEEDDMATSQLSQLNQLESDPQPDPDPKNF